MDTKSSRGKEIKIPGPDHSIAIMPAEGTVRTRALRLEEKGYPPVYYLPRSDADMSLFGRTTHYTYCPYKGDCTYYSIPIGGSNSEYAVWTYEKPYEAVADIKGAPGVLSDTGRCNRGDLLRSFSHSLQEFL